MIIQRFPPLLSEVMRPRKLEDLTLPSATIEKLSGLIKRGSPLNMVFYGRPGTGKTSAARIIAEVMQADTYDVNGALNKGITTVMADLEKWASGASLMPTQAKICIIDEAEQLNKKMQTALSYIIENNSDKTRFILTVNNLDKLCPPLVSRCEPISFDLLPSQAPDVIDRLAERYVAICDSDGQKIPFETARHLIAIYFPDLRQVANKFQFDLAA